MAAIGPKALRLAGAVADGVLLNAYVPPGYVRYAAQEVREAARAAGRDPQAIDIACMLVVRLTNDLGQMLPSLKQRLVRLLEEPYVGEILLDKGGFDPAMLGALRTAAAQGRQAEATSLVSEAMVEAFYLAGTASQCRARLAEYRAAGVDLPLLLPVWRIIKRLSRRCAVVRAHRLRAWSRNRSDVLLPNFLDSCKRTVYPRGSKVTRGSVFSTTLMSLRVTL